MNISEVREGQNNVNIEADVTDVSEKRTFNKFGRDLSVATATLKDSSGTIKLSLWNQDIDRIKAGDKVKITNGYVNAFQGEKQLTAGKFGKVEVVGKSDTPAREKSSEQPQQQIDEVSEEDIEEETEEEY